MTIFTTIPKVFNGILRGTVISEPADAQQDQRIKGAVNFIARLVDGEDHSSTRFRQAAYVKISKQYLNSGQMWKMSSAKT